MTLTNTPPKTDKQIQLDVLAEIARDNRFKPTELGVEVDGGVVTLIGTVHQLSEARARGRDRGRCSGRQGRPEQADRRDRGLRRPRRHEDRPGRADRARVGFDRPRGADRQRRPERDRYAQGTVDFWYERLAATDTVRNLLGVVAVNNQIVIAPPGGGSDAAIKEEVQNALMRRFPLHDLGVSVVRGAVTHTGEVFSYRDRRAAERVASTTPGVKSVVNRIEVHF